MSISSRIASIETHVGDAYDELERLGVDITSTNKNIENIGITLNDALTLVQPITEKGYNMTLKNTKKGSLIIAPTGNTEQDSYEGYNILPNNLISQQYEDVNVVVNSDGSIVLNGTVTTRRTLTLATVDFVEGQAYSMSGVLGGSDSTYQLWASSLSAFPEGNRLYSRNGKVTKTALATETLNVNLNLYVGAVLNNVIIYPMIILGSETKPYEKYVRRNTKSKQSFSTECESCYWGK